MTSGLEGVRGLLERAVPFLRDEGARYEDDGSNEPLELARSIEAELERTPPADAPPPADAEVRARELLAAECPECGGKKGYDVPDGNGSGRWQNCGTCRDDERLHSVNRYQALRAIVAALTQQPEARGVVDEDAAEALRFLLDRIGSWTYARWDQHLRHEFGDERATRMITTLTEARNVR